jgi:hypothetical protein
MDVILGYMPLHYCHFMLSSARSWVPGLHNTRYQKFGMLPGGRNSEQKAAYSDYPSIRQYAAFFAANDLEASMVCCLLAPYCQEEAFEDSAVWESCGVYVPRQTEESVLYKVGLKPFDQEFTQANASRCNSGL